MNFEIDEDSPEWARSMYEDYLRCLGLAPVLEVLEKALEGSGWRTMLYSGSGPSIMVWADLMTVHQFTDAVGIISSVVGAGPSGTEYNDINNSGGGKVDFRARWHIPEIHLTGYSAACELGNADARPKSKTPAPELSGHCLAAWKEAFGEEVTQ